MDPKPAETGSHTVNGMDPLRAAEQARDRQQALMTHTLKPKKES